MLETNANRNMILGKMKKKINIVSITPQETTTSINIEN